MLTSPGCPCPKPLRPVSLLTEPPLTILYHDEFLVVIDKPSGLLVHRTDLDRHETRFAVQLLRDQIGQRVWPVHRLDRGTSGVLIFALQREMASLIGQQFVQGEVVKKYLAIVRGHPTPTGIIDHPLSRQYDAIEHRGDLATESAQTAMTEYKRLAETTLPICVDRYPTSRYALLELTPLTGRKHQIRRHLKHIAHPIIGDATYGKGRHNRFFAEHFSCHRMLLACTDMQIRHPVTQATLHFHAPITGQYFDTLKALGWLPSLALTDTLLTEAQP